MLTHVRPNCRKYCANSLLPTDHGSPAISSFLNPCWLAICRHSRNLEEIILWTVLLKRNMLKTQKNAPSRFFFSKFQWHFRIRRELLDNSVDHAFAVQPSNVKLQVCLQMQLPAQLVLSNKTRLFSWKKTFYFRPKIMFLILPKSDTRSPSTAGSPILL